MQSAQAQAQKCEGKPSWLLELKVGADLGTVAAPASGVASWLLGWTVAAARGLTPPDSIESPVPSSPTLSPVLCLAV